MPARRDVGDWPLLAMLMAQVRMQNRFPSGSSSMMKSGYSGYLCVLICQQLRTADRVVGNGAVATIGDRRTEIVAVRGLEFQDRILVPGSQQFEAHQQAHSVGGMTARPAAFAMISWWTSASAL